MKETKEVVDYLSEVLDDLAGHKSDDGVIDGYEVTQTILANLPAGIKAGAGADKLVSEYKDASEEEKEELYKDMAALALKLAAVLGVLK